MRPARWGTLAVAGVFAACTPASEDSAAVASAGPDEDGAFQGTAEGLPAHAPAQFAFGAEATEDRIAAWDIDVRPDGRGLPSGSGSVADGREVFMIHCVACHGPTGTEGPNDRLVNSEQWDAYPTGRAVGNYWPYATTLYDYIRKAMPQLTPGILTHDQVYAVVAWILYMNEIVPEDAVMDAESLPAVVMPARDKFVVDDRVGGPGPVR
jgi:mono/diheme cytochrome c family protein